MLVPHGLFWVEVLLSVDLVAFKTVPPIRGPGLAMLRLDPLSVGAVTLVVIDLMLFGLIVSGIRVVWRCSWHIFFWLFQFCSGMK